MLAALQRLSGCWRAACRFIDVLVIATPVKRGLAMYLSVKSADGKPALASGAGARCNHATAATARMRLSGRNVVSHARRFSSLASCLNVRLAGCRQIRRYAGRARTNFLAN
ncbi:hypothetical protein KCP71_16700 [Salmonella enterica subsp. enterica]|nr:hypothetical protein KCP71_16700 [Salmonella enterica subsp. enterica]